MTRVLRLSKASMLPVQESWQEIHRLIDRLVGERPNWSSLPGPLFDRHIITGVSIDIERHELCGVVDERQLNIWWPRWSLHALTSEASEHDVVLDVYEVPEDGLRVGVYQAVFSLECAVKVASIPLAKSGLSIEDILYYLNNQNAHDVARGDRYAPLNLNA